LFESMRAALRQIASVLVASKLSDDELEELERYVAYRLLDCDVALEAAEAVARSVREMASELKVSRFEDRERLAESLLRRAITGVFEKAIWFDLEEEVLKIRSAGPVKIVLVGPNGHGKTTTLAKLGYRLLTRNLSVVFAAADTWRAGAIEQLKHHAEAIGAHVVEHGYGADPAAVAYDAVAYARKRRLDAVLVDTAGRLQTDTNLMEEVSKVVKVIKPHFKIFVGDALTGNDALDQAIKFNQYVGVDGGILTKVDADAKGGAALSFVYATGKPVLYVGTGQGYADLKPFTLEWFLEKVLS